VWLKFKAGSQQRQLNPKRVQAGKQEQRLDPDEYSAAIIWQRASVSGYTCWEAGRGNWEQV